MLTVVNQHPINKLKLERVTAVALSTMNEKKLWTRRRSLYRYSVD
jgi:hypothetical protein